MSGTDRSLLIIHIGFAIFTLGPLTAATMSTPRYIRRGDVPVLRYLHRATRLYCVVSLGTFLFGMFLAKGNFAKVWLTASMTLFIVALVLLLIVLRDQATAIRALENAAKPAHPEPAHPEPEKPEPAKPEPEKPAAGAEEPATRTPDTVKHDATIAQVQRGRIAALSGVVALIWLVVLALMVWH